MSTCVSRLFILICLSVSAGFLCASGGCANITTPTGGKKDTIPPKLVRITPPDSLLNTRVSRIEMHFDEYVTVGDATKEVHISPILAINPTLVGRNKTVIVKIVDTMLEDNTTYRLTFGNAIKDLHEGNPFKNYTYTFSTGNYFDSLQLRGTIINAATGLVDTGSIVAMLYSAESSDSAVVRKKPKYVTNVDAAGKFVFRGLPHRNFRIYAVKDVNGNLIYDGPEQGEMIAFNDSTVWPGDTSLAPINLRMFMEKLDTTIKKDTVAPKKDVTANIKKPKKVEAIPYTVNVDTSNADKRTFDITRPLKITFTQPFTLNKDRVSLTYDSAGVKVTPAISFKTDSLHPLELTVITDWAKDMVYTLRLPKGFAKDTSGTDIAPSRYAFHTWNDDDYGKIQIHLPTKYYSPAKDYVLMVTGDKDTIYEKPVIDTVTSLYALRPATYTFRIIVDKNHNGKWDTGDLFGKLQPELVIPYNDQIALRAGFEYIVDFEQKPPDNKSPDKGQAK